MVWFFVLGLNDRGQLGIAYHSLDESTKLSGSSAIMENVAGSAVPR
jgi:hypothetical protein